jgi:hypothetical protein
MTVYYLSALLFSLAGFACLAITMEKHCRELTGRLLNTTQRKIMYWLGWCLLAVALSAGVAGWHWSIGPVLLFGSLTAAGILLVFMMPWWPLQPKHAPRKEKPLLPYPDRPMSKVTQGLLILVLVALPAWVVLNAWKMSEQAVLRADAIHGQIGPWTFVIAEENQDGPEFFLGTPVKEFHLRFCEVCDSEIRAAYLKIRKPRSLRASGLAFHGARWTREVAISIPPAAALTDKIWLTVESKSGEIYHQAFDIQRLSPATARFIQEKK